MNDSPRLLDLFAGAGGCSVGYERAGFAVVGVDVEDHPDYPFPSLTADAMDVLTDHAFIDGFDVIHASPPCPRWALSTSVHNRGDHPDLLTPTLRELQLWAQRTGGVWVVENVPLARKHVPAFAESAALYCGRAMGLRWTRRHRLFASNVPLMSPGCACGPEQPYSVTGDSPERVDYGRNGRKARSVSHAQQITGCYWVTRWKDLADAIPPAYTQHVGEQIHAHAGMAHDTPPTKQ